MNLFFISTVCFYLVSLNFMAFSFEIGYTFGIPEVIVGLTFLAAGNCTPEALSSVIMIRKGENGVGISNSLGSSTLNIILSLGFTWFVRNLIHVNIENMNPFLHIKSNGFEMTILLLLLSVVILYIVLTIAKYRLNKIVGLCLFLCYLVLIIACISFQMNIFPSEYSR